MEVNEIKKDNQAYCTNNNARQNATPITGGMPVSLLF
jgi:hypothetical protein